MSQSIDNALSEWSTALQNDPQHQAKVQILKDSDSLENCIACSKKVIAELFPLTEKEVIDCVVIANKYKIPLYPISTGNNWGYGSSSPVTDNCVILNLGRMNQILEFDSDMGIITLQPGVTQRHLAQFLDENNYPYLIPVTGAGPDCSILGNAIERGYGITPYTDHFSSMMALEAILANGSVYKSALSQLGNCVLDGSHKWGIGPYLDGLFTQSNLGIVTKITILLAPKPERIETFFFGIKNTNDLDEIVLRIRKVLKDFAGITSAINLMNQHRVLAMTEPYPKEKLVDGLIPDEELKRMAAHRQLMVWTGIGALYGNAAVVQAAKKEIKKIMKPVAKRLLFFTPEKTYRLEQLVSGIPGLNKSIVAKTLTTLNKTILLFAGRPSEVALPMAYWISGKKPTNGSSMNPDKDGCGLIWYSPLVPMHPEKVKTFAAMAEDICRKHKIEPLITFTSLSDRCFDSTVPILFDRNDPDAVQRAHACYDELFDKGRELGFMPYRLGINSMPKLNQYQAVPDVLKKIKTTIDPNQIIAPGRYFPDDLK